MARFRSMMHVNTLRLNATAKGAFLISSTTLRTFVYILAFVLAVLLASSIVAVEPPPDFLSNTLWALSSDEINLERAQFKTQVLHIVPDLVPIDVNCDKIERCDKKGVCAIVCKHGSVQMDHWAQKALKLQRKLAYRRNFCSATLLGSHNSAINIADGYGVEDHVFEGYLHYFKWFKKGMTIHTNDQLFSLTDQLHMGVRFIELDVHWFDDDLHIAHCGGFKLKLLDGIITVFNDIAKILGTDIEWDSETIGCKPSMSSIPAKEQRPLKDALNELSMWLHAPENQDEFLIVFFDDETDLMKWNKVGKLLDYIKEYFAENEILRPLDLAYNTKWPTFEELLSVGKRVVFMSGIDYLASGEEILFVKDTVCNWQEPHLPLSLFPDCHFHESATKTPGSPDNKLTIFRPETSEIEYGILNAAGQFGINQNLLNEKSLPGVINCGINLPSPDNITPKRVEATIWVVTKGHELQPQKCVALLQQSKTWQSVDCNTKNLVAACVDVNNPRHWQLGSSSVVEADAVVACAALPFTVMEYSVPACGYENELLYRLLMMQQNGLNSTAGVWLNAKHYVDDVYSTRINDSVVHATTLLVSGVTSIE